MKHHHPLTRLTLALFSVLLALGVFRPVTVWANHPCGSALHDAPSKQKALASLYDQAKPVALENSQDLVSALVEANAGIFFKEEFLKTEPTFLKTLKVKKIKELAPHDRFGYYLASVELTYRGRAQELQVFFRSNGSSAFLSSTWQLEQERSKVLKPVVVFRSEQRGIEAMTHTEAVLKTLPDKITLSRSMNPKEFELWKSGDISKIKSQINMFGSSSDAVPKTTFALNYYRFNGDEPYLFEIEKSKLLELEQQGLLSINTYEDAAVSRSGLTAEAQTPFGLEVEIVVHGLEGRKQILGVMQSPLQVPK